MPKRIIPLTDMKVLKAKPQDRPVSLFDGGGLYLLVTPTGGKLWRFKYRFDSKEKKLLGELWEKKNGGKGLFLMAVKFDGLGRGVFEQLGSKVSA
jgi:hypothetical protein